MPIVILARLVQLSNALSPIEVTPSGIVMLVRFVQLRNAVFPIEITGNPSYTLGMTKEPLADVRQSETA